MAHAFVLAHAADFGEAGEEQAFRAFAETFTAPTTQLVDTFDTLRGVDRAVEGARDSLAGVRIDSGDLAALALNARTRLDLAGRAAAKIVLSNDLDEYTIDVLTRAHIPADAFGVGTMAVATPDAPSLGAVYKLVALEDASGRMVAVQKRASGSKGSSAGIKQVFRRPGTLDDVLALDSESLDGDRLLQPVESMDLSLAAARARLQHDLAAAPELLKSIEPRREGEAFPVTRSDALVALQERVDREGRVVL
jgi:nicotinate phosphoribosyltransferase